MRNATNNDQLIHVEGIGELTVAEFLGEWLKDLAPVYKEVERRINQVRTSLMREYYELGVYLNEQKKRITDKCQREGHSTYRLHFFARIAAVLGISERTLRDCAKVAEVFAAAEFNKMCQKPHLTWSHARILAVEPNKQNRAKWTERVASEQLNVNELAAALRDDRKSDADTGNETADSSGSGRSPALPKTINGALHRLSTTATRFTDVQQMLFGDDYIADVIQHLPSDDLTPAVRDRVAGCLEKIVSLEESLPIAHTELEKILQFIDDVIVAHAEAVKRNSENEKAS